MKKIISAVLVIGILLTVFVPLCFASAETKISTIVYGNKSGNYYNVTVKGTCEEGLNLSVIVKNKNGVVKAIDECRTADGNTFEKTLIIDINGDTYETDGFIKYTVYIRDYRNSGNSKDFELYSDEKKKDFAEEFNTAAKNDDKTEMQNKIEKYKSIFGFDMTFYTGMEETISQHMIYVAPFTIDDISKKFDDAVINAYLFGKEFSADRTEIIEYYDTALKFKSGFDGKKSFYDDYIALDSGEKEWVNETAFAKSNLSKNHTELKEAFFMAITAQCFKANSADNSKSKKFLTNHNDWFELEGFSSLTTAQLKSIIDKFETSDIPDNKRDFVKLYNGFKNTASGGEGVQKPATGGGGGAVSAVPVEPIGYDKITAPAAPAVDVNGQQPSKLFTDLEGYEWAKEAIMYLSSNGIVNGKGDGKFSPGDKITREEFAKILALAYHMESKNTDNSFTDVSPDRWSYQYISNVYNNGIVTGYPDGRFGPGETITRQDMALMMSRALLKFENIEIETLEFDKFNDGKDISDYAKNSVATLYQLGIISGDDKGNFNPKDGAARAEICVMVYNALKRGDI